MSQQGWLLGPHTRAVVTAVFLASTLMGQVSAARAEILSSDRVDGRKAAELGVPKDALPDVSMKAGALVTDDGRVLWVRRGADRRAIASITKIMTAVVALEHGDLEEPVTVPGGSSSPGESTAFLRRGERLPLGEVLEASLVKSGNDAAYTLAAHLGGSQDGFVEMMNEKADELGLFRTRFANTHGLDADGQYSTATDVAVLARYAMTNPEFRRIVGQKTAEIGEGKRAEKVANTNLLIGNYRGANGVKTGWTNRAGYSVVGSAARDGIELYAVVLGAPSESQRFRDARELLDFGFAHYRPQRLSTAGTVVGEAPVSDYLDRMVAAEMSEDATVSVFDLAGPITRTVTVSSIAAPVTKGDRIGVATFTQGDDIVATVPLVAVEDVDRPHVLARVGIAVVRMWWRITGKT